MKKRIVMLILTAGIMAVSGCGGTSAATNEEIVKAVEETTSAIEGKKTEESAPAETEAKGEIVTAAASDRTIKVNATGKVKSEPDMASVTLAVETNDIVLTDAQSLNSEWVDSVVKTLTDLGVKENSIQTTDYSVYPKYDDYGMEIVGYDVSTTLEVSDIPIKDVGELITACGNLAITSIRNIQYFCSGYDASYEEALGAAVAAAEKKAGVLAEACGKELGDLISVEEGYQDTSLQYVYDNGKAMYAAAEGMGAGEEADVMPGQVTINADVTVTFELK